MQFIHPVSHQAPKKSSSTSPCHPFCRSPQESKQGASSDLSPRKAGPWNPSLASGPFYVLTAGPALQVLAGTEVEGILSPNFTLGMRVCVSRAHVHGHMQVPVSKGVQEARQPCLTACGSPSWSTRTPSLDDSLGLGGPYGMSTESSGYPSVLAVTI